MVKYLVDPVFGEDYNEGYVFFSHRTDGFYAKGITLFTGDGESGIPITHCGIITGNGTCIEAKIGKCISEVDFDEEYLQQENCTVVIRKPLRWSPDRSKASIAAARESLGLAYSTGGVIGLILQKIFTFGYAWFPSLKYQKNPFNSNQSMFCSELVSDAMKPSYGPDGVLQYHPSNIEPQELFECPILWKEWNYDIVAEKVEEGKRIAD